LEKQKSKFTGQLVKEMYDDLKSDAIENLDASELILFKRALENMANEFIDGFVAQERSSKFFKDRELAWHHVWEWLMGHDSSQLNKESSKVVSKMLKKLSHPDDNKRVKAAYILGSIGKAALPGLKEALSAKEEFTRRNASYALIALGKDCIPDITKQLKSTSSLTVQARIVFVLGELGRYLDNEAIDAILFVLSESKKLASRERDYTTLRVNIAETLGNLPHNLVEEKHLEELIQLLLNDEDAQVRFCAAFALGKLGKDSPNVLSALIRALNDTNRYVVGYSIEFLHRLGKKSPKAQEALLTALMTSRWCPYTTTNSTF